MAQRLWRVFERAVMLSNVLATCTRRGSQTCTCRGSRVHPQRCTCAPVGVHACTRTGALRLALSPAGKRARKPDINLDTDRAGQKVTGRLMLSNILESCALQTSRRSKSGITGFQYRETMNSRRPNSAEQPFGDWLSKAKRKFAGATIHNSGQFAVCVMDHKNVYLFDDFFAAMTFMEGHAEYRLHDLAEAPYRPCPTIPEPFDVDEMRRERREKKQA